SRSDPVTPAWLECDTQVGTLLLDPTFNWAATIKLDDRRSYIAFYGYEGAHKYQAADSLLVNRTLAIHSPAAPSQGVITRPTRSTWRMPSSPWLFDEDLVDPRFFSNRSAF